MGTWQRPPLRYPTEYIVAYDLETIVDQEMPDGTFPPWPRHRPVAGSFLTARWTPQGTRFKFETLLCEEGREEQFYHKVDELLPEGCVGVSLNGRNFDNVVLRLQAQKHGLFDLPNVARQASSGRFDIAHLDLMDAFGGGRGTSLAELCRALDIPVKTSVNGGDVAELWRRGDAAALVVRWRWDSAADRGEFVGALGAYVADGAAGAPAAIDVRGGAVTLAIAPDAATAARLARVPD